MIVLQKSASSGKPDRPNVGTETANSLVQRLILTKSWQI